jgi:hypothetical protein
MSLRLGGIHEDERGTRWPGPTEGDGGILRTVSPGSNYVQYNEVGFSSLALRSPSRPWSCQTSKPSRRKYNQQPLCGRIIFNIRFSRHGYSLPAGPFFYGEGAAFSKDARDKDAAPWASTICLAINSPSRYRTAFLIPGPVEPREKEFKSSSAIQIPGSWMVSTRFSSSIRASP